jgi:Flp pilus assembly pilin Flp
MQFISNAINSIVARVMSIGSDDREEGQTLVEYALIIALVSVVLVLSLTALKDGIAGVFTDIVNEF